MTKVSTIRALRVWRPRDFEGSGGFWELEGSGDAEFAGGAGGGGSLFRGLRMLNVFSVVCVCVVFFFFFLGGGGGYVCN